MILRRIILILLASCACCGAWCQEANRLPGVRERIDSADWGRIATTLGVRVSLKLAVDASLKHYVREWRPDYSDTRSFPSRHSTWAYGIGGTIAYEMGAYSPWWALGAQAAANGVGFQRVMASRHWPGDVMAGAGIGLGTDMLSRCIGNWIFGYENRYSEWHLCENAYRPGISLSTGVSIPFSTNYGSYTIGTALESSAMASAPIGNNLGVCANISLWTAPIKHNGRFIKPFTSIAVTAGANAHWNPGAGPFAISVMAAGGYRKHLSPGANIKVSGGSPLLQTSAQFSIMLTHRLSIGAEAGYELGKLTLAEYSHAASALTVSFLTRACF